MEEILRKELPHFGDLRRKPSTLRYEAIIGDQGKLCGQIGNAEDPFAYQSMYDRIVWFDICWEESDLQYAAEFREFRKWRENCLFHEVITWQIPVIRNPSIWLRVETEKFLEMYGQDDTGRTPLIINYGDHGDSGTHGLILCSHGE